MEDIVKLAETVQQMRTTQKEYFRTRSSLALAASKKLEKSVDDMLSSVIKSPTKAQADMFGNAFPIVHADLKHELKFCQTEEFVPNQHGRFIYTSADGAHSFAVPEILSEYRDWLNQQGLTKDYQRA